LNGIVAQSHFHFASPVCSFLYLLNNFFLGDHFILFRLFSQRVDKVHWLLCIIEGAAQINGQPAMEAKEFYVFFYQRGEVRSKWSGDWYWKRNFGVSFFSLPCVRNRYTGPWTPLNSIIIFILRCAKQNNNNGAFTIPRTRKVKGEVVSMANERRKEMR
jgi:hypothetical protein